MHGEAPEFKRCCCCLPLRRGLIGWGYTKLVFNILSIIYVAYDIYRISLRKWPYLNAEDVVIISVMEICLLLDMVFNIIFIVAGHKGSVKLLKISYIYNIVWICLLTLGFGYVLYVNLTFAYMWFSHSKYRMNFIVDLFTLSIYGFSVIFLQIYLILMIRSEMMKLRRQTLEMKFTNLAASEEPQCTLYNASTEQCTDEKQSVHDCTDGSHAGLLQKREMQ